MKATITIQGKTFNEFPDLIKNDTGFVIQFNVLQNDEETAFDLTGATPITFKARVPDATSNKIEGVCTITDATNGLCTYTVVSTDLDKAQVLEAELEVINSGVINTAKLGKISILEDLP